ncbi:MAG: ABC transporter permease subunit [Planctomycetota bacterium]|nr:MAG: ABC transporter permease subunit [Planctomycetota bacterium]
MTARDNPRPRRVRTTSRSVRVAERLARTLISVGGIGTIAAVVLILAFLLSVVQPMFRASAVESQNSHAAAGRIDGRPVRVGTDAYQLIGWTLLADGRLVYHDLESGAVLESLDLASNGAPPSAIAATSAAGEFALAYPDGTLRFCRADFTMTFVDAEQATAPLLALAIGQSAAHGRGRVQRISVDQWRVQEPAATLQPPLQALEAASAERIVALDFVRASQGLRAAWLTSAGAIEVGKLDEREDPMTGETRVELARFAVPAAGGEGRPARLVLTGFGDSLLAIWDDGRAVRYDLRQLDRIAVAEAIDLLPGGAARIGALELLIGRGTLAVGGSDGSLVCWFRVRPDLPTTVDGTALQPVHVLAAAGPAITSLASSERSRLLASGGADGSVRMYYVPTNEERVVAQPFGAAAGPIDALAFAPKEDGCIVHGAARVAHLALDIGHPDGSVRALFTPLWYEGYSVPEHVWQSSSGTDESEPKLGLVPLVFGTLKATFFSLLFGVPIALLAAIFTAEFLPARLRTPIKSTIEMMASLPSVVLGFLAAIVIAPFVQQWLPSVLALFATLPLCLLGGAYLWQLLPARTSIRLANVPRFLCVAACVPLAGALALFAGPWIERVWFGGDVEGWLDASRGSAFPGWFWLLLPLACATAIFACGRFAGPWLRRASASWSRSRCASFDIARFGAIGLATVGIAALFAWLLQQGGFDARGSVLDTYVQRNALVVGFVMGFAVIPIIYTLAEDALTSVPQSLRLASLGAGATPWQTAVRIVVPTAGSGLFSAIMVGLGRAVGETMIVLMATGNTPVMEWNVFNGFRTLSANIAVELPEAARDSTHYRTLFLAALTLFAITFVVNTLAEVVRQRFRKRSYQL